LNKKGHRWGKTGLTLVLATIAVLGLVNAVGEAALGFADSEGWGLS
jgi:hypothetical protein